MTKADLINVVSENCNLPKKTVGLVLNDCFEKITKALSTGDRVQIVGFGTFEVRNRKERKGRNPSNGEEIIIPESKVPAFKPGKALKEAIAK